MNSLERAKQFLRGKASRLALAIAPLAAVAIPGSLYAGAVGNGVVFNPNAACVGTAQGGSASCTVTQENAVGGNTGANFVAFFGSGTSTGLPGFIDFDVAEASATGVIGIGSIPVSWLFSTSSVNVNTDSPSQGGTNFVTTAPISYSLHFDVLIQPFGSGSGLIDPSFDFSSSTALNSASVHGSGSIAIPQAGTVLGYEMSLDTSGSVAYSVNIPAGLTVNLNNIAAVATPEPASLLMIPGAAAVLFLRRRKRKA